MGCLHPVHIVCASFIYFGGTMSIKHLCWTLTRCLQRQMSTAIKRRLGEAEKEDAVTATESCFHQSLTCTQGLLQQGLFRKYKEMRVGSKKTAPDSKRLNVFPFLTLVSPEAFLGDSCVSSVNRHPYKHILIYKTAKTVFFFCCFSCWNARGAGREDLGPMPEERETSLCTSAGATDLIR